VVEEPLEVTEQIQFLIQEVLKEPLCLPQQQVVLVVMVEDHQEMQEVLVDQVVVGVVLLLHVNLTTLEEQVILLLQVRLKVILAVKECINQVLPDNKVVEVEHQLQEYVQLYQLLALLEMEVMVHPLHLYLDVLLNLFIHQLTEFIREVVEVWAVMLEQVDRAVVEMVLLVEEPQELKTVVVVVEMEPQLEKV